MPDNSNTAETAKPRCRWFQFRLRTMLIAVALLAVPCAYVAHEARFVAARKEWLTQHSQLARNGETIPLPTYLSPRTELPIVRRLLGDESCDRVPIDSADEEQRAEELFPEAVMIVKPYR